MDILAQFLLRLTFGLAVGMAITSTQHVSSGFFRNHLYVTLGLTSFASLVTYSRAPDAFWFAVGAAVISYIGSVCWLYQNKAAGLVAVFVIMLFSLSASYRLLESTDIAKADRVYDRYLDPVPANVSIAEAESLVARSRHLGYMSTALTIASNVSSGLLLGLTSAAMLLGHWYLNSPGMQLAPLKRLLAATGAAVLLQAAVSAIGLGYELGFGPGISTHWFMFIMLRWSFGLVGVAVLVWMAWQTLKIPNTQSATGILYVAVIGVFVGELTSALLSAESAFPL